MFKKNVRPFWTKKCPFLAIITCRSKNSQIDSKITETISGKKVSIFGHLSCHKYMLFRKNHRFVSKLPETISGKKVSVFGHHYMPFKKIHRLTQKSLRPFRAKKCPFLAIFLATNTCCSEKNHRFVSKLPETISGKKVSVFGHHYMPFKKIHRLTQ